MKKIKVSNNLGFSIIELFITMGVIAVIFAGFTKVMESYSDQQQRVAFADRKQEILISIINIINNDIAWQKTVDYLPNTNLNCIKEKAKFPMIPNADNCNAADGGNFSLLDEAGNPYVNFQVPTAGFSLIGGACNTYSPGGDDACPLRADLTWRPLCTTCTNNQIEINITLNDNPTTRKNAPTSILTRTVVRYARPFDIDLVLHLKMDGAGATALGQQINDFSGNRNHATVLETAGGPMPSFQPGKVGQSVLFQTNKYLNLAESSSLKIGGAITISAWVKLGAAPAGQAGIVDKRFVGINDSYVLRAEPGLYLFCVAENPGNRCVDAAGAVVGVWQHVVGVWDAKDIRIYVDGVLRNTLGYNGPNFYENFPILIGAEDQGGVLNFFPGQIDEVKIWKRALTAGDVMREFNNP